MLAHGRANLTRDYPLPSKHKNLFRFEVERNAFSHDTTHTKKKLLNQISKLLLSFLCLFLSFSTFIVLLRWTTFTDDARNRDKLREILNLHLVRDSVTTDKIRKNNQNQVSATCVQRGDRVSAVQRVLLWIL